MVSYWAFAPLFISHSETRFLHYLISVTAYNTKANPDVTFRDSTHATF